MIAATYTQGRGLSVQDIAAPAVAEGELLLRVGASAICGTDLRTIENGHRRLRAGQRIVLGHEFAGSIESAPGADDLFPPGTRVAVAPNVGCGQCEQCIQGRTNMCPEYNAFGVTWDGAHTEYIRIPHVAISQGNVVPLPARTTFIEAALIEPLACVVNGSREARIAVGDVVVIVGAGPIGLLHLQLARLSGASLAIVADIRAQRLGAAKELGADVIVNSTEEDLAARIREETGGRGCDVVITACSDASVQQESIGWLAPYGRVCFFGGLPQAESEVSLETNAIHYKNLLVTGATGGSLHDFRIAARLMASKRVEVERVISHVYPLSDMGLAFEQALRREAMKVVLQQDGKSEEQTQ